MAKLKFYGYDKCGTCRKAAKWLDENDVAYDKIPIVEKPPSKKLLKQILKSGDYSLKQLFNTSGVQYRELNMKERLPDMSEAEAVDLLASNGKLCKRPIVTDGTTATVGFKENTFESTWG